MRKKPATVRFIGNQEDYRLGCGYPVPQPSGYFYSWKYCADCPKQDCGKDKMSLPTAFIEGNLYKAYLLVSFTGEYDWLYVSEESGCIDASELKDFEVVSDPDNVVAIQVARVRCLSSSQSLFGCQAGKTYDCIGASKSRHEDDEEFSYHVMEEDGDTMPYPPSVFEIVSDPYNILDVNDPLEIYWW